MADEKPRTPGKWRAPPPAAAAFTIDEFCAAHRLSPSMYFKLREDGHGPREMKVGTRKMISAESAARWRRRREREAATAEIAKRKSAEISGA